MQQNSINSINSDIDSISTINTSINFDRDVAVWNSVDFLVGDNEIVEQMSSIPALTPFNDQVTAFLTALSEKLMKTGSNRFSDITTFAFWIRRANLIKMKQRFGMDPARMVNTVGDVDRFRLGRGTVFHIAPSNVPVNFAYSLVASLLMGNSNIVRVPSKDFEQVRIITTAINCVLDEGHEHMRPYLACVKYESQSKQARAINDLFSSLCDVRIVWGGDRTIATLRQSPLPPRSTEVMFADRYSMCVIDADEYLELESILPDETLSGQRKQTERQQVKQQEKKHNQKLSTIAYNFFNDTYLTDQNACTSPKVIIWTGKQVKKAMKIFWDYLHYWVKGKYKIQAIQAVDKLTRAYIEAAIEPCLASSQTANLSTGGVASGPSASINTVSKPAALVEDDLSAGIKIEKAEDNLITRVTVPSVDILIAIKDSSGFNNNSGYFYEYVCKNSSSHDSLMELRSLFDDKHCQTVCYIGDKDMFTGLLESGVKGVDRIVPIGQTMDFDLLWDGYDLTRELTRVVTTRTI